MTKRFVMGLAAAVFLLSGVGRARAEYIVTDLGTLGNNNWNSWASGINDAGQVVGSASSDHGGMHAFRYSDGKMTDLTPSALYGSEGTGINSSGQVIFNVFGGFEKTQAYLYDGGKITNLGTLGGFTFGSNYTVNNATANGINDSGQIVGTSMSATGGDHAFLYSGGKMTDLGTLPGGLGSSAAGINNAGQVVGISSIDINATHGHAFLYSNGKMTDLGTLGGSDSRAVAINNSGQVIGYSRTADSSWDTFLYSKGKMTSLGLFDVGGINDAGRVVGTRYVGGNLNYKGSTMEPGYLRQDPVPHAFLFINGKLTDLNSLIPANSGWILDTATGINNFGQIVGFGHNSSTASGAAHAYLLTPVEVPEPGSLALFGLGALGLAGHAWRKRRQRAIR